MTKIKRMKIFISYSHQNENIANELISVINDVWPDTITFFKAKSDLVHKYNSVHFGDWLKVIQDHLISSDIIIGLISKEYITSKWFFAELGGALFFGKTVIPVCIKPIKKTSLPAPFNRLQAYSYEKNEILLMLSNINHRNNLSTNFAIDMNSYPFLLKEGSPPIDNRANIIFNSFFSLNDINKFLVQKKLMGNHLASLFNEYSATILMESFIESDEYGNANIVRDIKIIPNNYISHWYYSIHLDEVGVIKIKDIIDLDSKKQLHYLIHSQNSREVMISILFAKTIKKGEEINLRITSSAENFISDLTKNGLCQLYYNNPKNFKIKQYNQIISFPDSNTFKDITCYIMSAGGNDTDTYKPITSLIKGERRELKINILSKDGFTDRVLIELRL